MCLAGAHSSPGCRICSQLGSRWELAGVTTPIDGLRVALSSSQTVEPKCRDGMGGGQHIHT